MSSWKQQALIEAPVEEVWGLISDPGRFPEWSDVEVTGVPTEIERGATFRQRTRGPLGIRPTTTFEVQELDEDVHEIRLRCQTSGYYSHWLLTEARGSTFVELELGMEPEGVKERVGAIGHTKRFLRRMADGALDGLRRALAAT